jgi:hypothetical protein
MNSWRFYLKWYYDNREQMSVVGHGETISKAKYNAYLDFSDSGYTTDFGDFLKAIDKIV